MKIVCDKHIPFLVEAIQNEWPRVQIYPMESEEIDALAVHDADVLVVRTRTKIDADLLGGSSVKLVCTATIGYDHIDTTYCDAHGVRWMACPGCNAQAVCDYIEEALDEVEAHGTIGIVGVGHVGLLVAKMAERKGYHVLLNDPPKNIGVSLDEIAKNCDVITFHVPLDSTTYHLCDASFLSRCKPNALIINAARGGVVDEQALLQSRRPYILDTWENEPMIDTEVLKNALRASMHIAGYSIEGKRNATQMCVDAIAKEWNLPAISLANYPCAQVRKGDSEFGWLERITNQLKAKPSSFELLRKQYNLR